MTTRLREMPLPFTGTARIFPCSRRPQIEELTAPRCMLLSKSSVPGNELATSRSPSKPRKSPAHSVYVNSKEKTRSFVKKARFPQGYEIFRGRGKLVIHFRFVDDHRTSTRLSGCVLSLDSTGLPIIKWRDGTCRCQVRICDDAFLGVRIMVTSPKEVYVGDITYLPIKGGKNMYLVTVMVLLQTSGGEP